MEVLRLGEPLRRSVGLSLGDNSIIIRVDIAKTYDILLAVIDFTSFTMREEHKWTDLRALRIRESLGDR